MVLCTLNVEGAVGGDKCTRIGGQWGRGRAGRAGCAVLQCYAVCGVLNLAIRAQDIYFRYRDNPATSSRSPCWQLLSSTDRRLKAGKRR